MRDIVIYLDGDEHDRPDSDSLVRIGSGVWKRGYAGLYEQKYLFRGCGCESDLKRRAYLYLAEHGTEDAIQLPDFAEAMAVAKELG